MKKLLFCFFFALLFLKCCAQVSPPKFDTVKCDLLFCRATNEPKILLIDTIITGYAIRMNGKSFIGLDSNYKIIKLQKNQFITYNFSDYPETKNLSDYPQIKYKIHAKKKSKAF